MAYKVFIDGKVHYRGFSAEEDKLFNETIREVFVKEFEEEKIKQEALIWESYDNGDLTDEGLVESLKAARKKDYSMWVEVIARMYDRYGIVIKRATKTEKSAF